MHAPAHFCGSAAAPVRACAPQRPHLRRRLARTLMAAILAASSPALHAQIYKCAGTGHVPVYQDRPCAAGQELRNLAVDPAEVSVLPMPPLPPVGGTASGNARAVRTPPSARNAPRAERTRGGDPAQRRYLFTGMQAGEVLARAGPPDMKAGGGKSSRWTYLPHPGDAQTLTTVVIEEGRVVDVERKVVR